MELEDVTLDRLPDGFLPSGHARSCTLSGADLAETTTTAAWFDTCRMANADLSGSRHDGTAFVNCDLRGANLATAVLAGCKLTGSDLTGARLLGLQVDGGDWSYTNLRSLDLVKVSLAGVRLAHADLADAGDLSGALTSESQSLNKAAVSSSDAAKIEKVTTAFGGLRQRVDGPPVAVDIEQKAKQTKQLTEPLAVLSP